MSSDKTCQTLYPIEVISVDPGKMIRFDLPRSGRSTLFRFSVPADCVSDLENRGAGCRTLLRFPHLLEEHKLATSILPVV